MAEPWQVLFFQDDDGHIPARDYLLTLEDASRKRFQTRLQVLTEKGLATGKPIMDHLEKNLYEMRLENSPGNPRFLFCALIGRRLYLLHGFSKPGHGSAGDEVPESHKAIARKRRDILEARERLAQEAVEQPKGKQAKKF